MLLLPDFVNTDRDARRAPPGDATQHNCSFRRDTIFLFLAAPCRYNVG